MPGPDNTTEGKRLLDPRTLFLLGITAVASVIVGALVAYWALR